MITCVCYGCEQMSQIIVKSNPSGADVYLDEQFIGTTPLSMEVKASDSSWLHVTKGIRGNNKLVKLEGKDSYEFDLDLKLARVDKEPIMKKTHYLQFADGLTFLPSGEIVLGGSTNNYWTSVGASRSWVKLLDKNSMDALWTTSLVSQSQGYKRVNNLLVANDGNIVAIGNVSYAFFSRRHSIRMTKLSVEGEILWDRYINTKLDPYNPKYDVLIDSHQLPNGDILLTGYRKDMKGWLMKVDSQGNKKWEILLVEKAQKKKNALPLAVGYLEDLKNIVVFSKRDIQDGVDCIISIINKSGEEVSTKNIPFKQGFRSILKAVLDADNNLIISGYVKGNENQISPFVTKVSSQKGLVFHQFFDEVTTGMIDEIGFEPETGEIVFSGDRNNKSFFGELSPAGEIKWLQFNKGYNYPDFSTKLITKYKGEIIYIKGLPNYQIDVFKEKFLPNDNLAKRSYHTDNFLADVLERGSSSRRNPKAANRNEKTVTKEYGNLYVTVTESSFLGDYELDSYYVKIIREKDLSGNYVYDEEQEYSYSGGFLSESPHFYSIAHGYYKIEFYGTTSSGNKQVIGSASNVKHVKNSEVDVHLGGEEVSVKYF